MLVLMKSALQQDENYDNYCGSCKILYTVLLKLLSTNLVLTARMQLWWIKTLKEELQSVFNPELFLCLQSKSSRHLVSPHGKFSKREKQMLLVLIDVQCFSYSYLVIYIVIQLLVILFVMKYSLIIMGRCDKCLTLLFNRYQILLYTGI